MCGGFTDFLKTKPNSHIQNADWSIVVLAHKNAQAVLRLSLVLPAFAAPCSIQNPVVFMVSVYMVICHALNDG